MCIRPATSAHGQLRGVLMEDLPLAVVVALIDEGVTGRHHRRLALRVGNAEHVGPRRPWPGWDRESDDRLVILPRGFSGSKCCESPQACPAADSRAWPP